MASERTRIKTCLALLTRSVFSIPLTSLSLASSYLTVEEAAMRSPFIIQTPFFDASILNNTGDGENAFKLYTSPSQMDEVSTSTSKQQQQTPASPITIPTGDGHHRIPLTTWKDSLLSTLVHYLEEEPFTLKIKAKFIYKTTIVGLSSTYDLTFCDSDYFIITKELLEKSLKEMGMRTGNGSMMLNSFRWAFAYMFNLSTRDGLMGSFSSVSEKDFERKPKKNKNKKKEEKEKDISSSSTSDSYSSSSDKENGSHGDDTITITTSSTERQHQKQERKLKILLRNKKVLRRFCQPLESFSSDDEEESFYLNPVTLDNTQSASVDTHFLDERRLVDSSIDRSALVVCGCINILQTISGVLNNLKSITPERPYKPTKNQNDEPFSSKESRTHVDKVFNQKIPAFPSSDIKLRDEVHTIIQNKNEKQYNVHAYAKEISDVIGIWGNDDLYLKFLGDLRQGTGGTGSGSTFVGFQKMKERLEPEEQGNFGSYLTSEKSSSSSSSSSTSPTITSMDQQNQEKTFIENGWETEVKMMFEERDMYKESVEYGVSTVFKCISDFMVSIDDRYKKLLEKRTFVANTPNRRHIYEKTKARDFVNSVPPEDREEAARLYDGSQKLKSIQTHIYKGTKFYRDLAEFHKPLINYYINIMDSEGFLPFYHDHGSESNLYTSYFADYYQIHEKMSSEEFCKRMSLSKDGIGDEQDEAIAKILAENDMQDMFSYKIIIIEKEQVPVLCIFGIPEAILYNEMATLKWLATAWKCKTKTECKAFENSRNQLSLKNISLIGLCSKLWRAKSYVTMQEYEICHINFQKKFLEDRILQNIVPHSKRRNRKTDSDPVNNNDENLFDTDENENHSDGGTYNDDDGDGDPDYYDEEFLSDHFSNFNILDTHNETITKSDKQ